MSGVIPERPAKFGSAPLASSSATVAWRSFSAAPNSAVEPATLRASIAAPCARKSLVSAKLSGACGVRQRHRAETVARFE